jgi:putative ATPase
MLDAGEDPLYIARRMVVMASEDIGLADNSMLSLATAAYTAVQIVGMPEARINLVHCAAALAEAKKSTRSYRGMGRAINFLKDPACRGAPVPPHLRDPGDGTYKYNPDYLHGQVKQDYMPLGHESVTFLDNIDLGTMVDPDLEDVVTGAGRPRKLADFL